MHIYENQSIIFFVYFLTWVLFVFCAYLVKSSQTPKEYLEIDFVDFSNSCNFENITGIHTDNRNSLFAQNYYNPHENKNINNVFSTCDTSIENKQYEGSAYVSNVEESVTSDLNSLEKCIVRSTHNNYDHGFEYSYMNDMHTDHHWNSVYCSDSLKYMNQYTKDLHDYCFKHKTNEALPEELHPTSQSKMEEVASHESSAEFNCLLHKKCVHFLKDTTTEERLATYDRSEFYTEIELENLITELLNEETKRLVKEFDNGSNHRSSEYISNVTLPYEKMGHNNSINNPSIECDNNRYETSNDTEPTSSFNFHFQEQSYTKATHEMIHLENERSDKESDKESSIYSDETHETYTRTYKSIFKNTAHCLKDIYICVQNIHSKNEEQRIKDLIETINKNSESLNHVKCPIIVYKQNGKNNHLMKLLDRIELSKPLLETKDPSYFDSFTILDTTISMRLYIELVLFFSSNNVIKYKYKLKQIYHNKKNLIENLSKHEQELSKDSLNLEKFFLQLIVPTQMKGLLYRLQHFYFKIFDINEELDLSNDTIFISSMSDLINKVDKIKKRIKNIIRSVSETRRKDRENSCFQKYQMEINKILESLRISISEIVSEQERMKTMITQNLKASKTIIYYITLHLLFLFLHRLLASVYIKSENKNCTEVFKLFIEKCESMFPNILVSIDINDLNRTEQSLILNDEDSIRHILTYLFLNLIKYILREVVEGYSIFMDAQKKYEKNKEPHLEREMFFECLDKLERMTDLLKNLYSILNGMKKEKRNIQIFINLLNIREQINEEVRNALTLIKKSEKNINHLDYKELVYIYNHILHLYENFFTSVKRDIL